MSHFEDVIKSSVGNDEVFTILSFSTPNSKEIGSYGASNQPKNIWYDGKTFITGQNNSNDNNSPIVIEYDSSDGTLSLELVYTLTNADPLEHARPSIIEYGGFIYVAVVNGHGQEILIFKSNSLGTSRNGFTLHHTIPGAYGYQSLKIVDNNRLMIFCRGTNPVSTPNMSQIILLSDPNDFTNFNEISVTDADYINTQDRHYPSDIKHYENNNWHYFGISIRHEDGGIGGFFFAQAIYKTQDFTTFWNLDETFSKDVITNGEITHTELFDNFVFIGDLANRTLDDIVGGVFAIVINDVLYNSYYDTNNNLYKFMKVENGIITLQDSPFLSDPLPNNAVGSLNPWFNGNNLVYRVLSDIYKFDLNWNNQVGPFLNVTSNLKIPPYNLDKVTGKYMIGGSNIPDQFYFIITDNKFN